MSKNVSVKMVKAMSEIEEKIYRCDKHGAYFKIKSDNYLRVYLLDNTFTKTQILNFNELTYSRFNGISYDDDNKMLYALFTL